MTTQAPGDNIVLQAGKAGLVSFPGITVESARIASEILQRNSSEYDGFHNAKGTYSVPNGGINTANLTCLLA